MQNLIKDKETAKSYYLAQKFFDLMESEIRFSKKLYGIKDSQSLKKYYKNILNSNYYNYIKHYYAIRLTPLISNLKPKIKILDAGCGVGSESILCSILGASVTGIDLSETRLKIAKKRVSYYEKKFQKKININFYLKNIFKHDEHFDLIWANEAISHINPAIKFIKFCYNHLYSKGKIIIADGNNLNPYLYIQNKKIQRKKGGIYTIKKDPSNGKYIPYAIERCFSIPDIKSIIKNYFKICNLRPFTFIPYFIFNKFRYLCSILDYHIFPKIPIINTLSLRYVIVGEKNSNYMDF